MKIDVICAYAGYNIVTIQKQLIGIASLISDISQKNTSVIASTHFISKAPFMFKKYNDMNLISEVPNSLDSKINMCVDIIIIIIIVYLFISSITAKYNRTCQFTVSLSI
jgi:hypothetical protein